MENHSTTAAQTDSQLGAVPQQVNLANQSSVTGVQQQQQPVHQVVGIQAAQHQQSQPQVVSWLMFSKFNCVT